MSDERKRWELSNADESTITLHGLRVAWAPERVVPWADLLTNTHSGGMTAWPIDSEGHRLRVDGRPVGWTVPLGYQRTVAGMVRRARQRALESGQYVVTVNCSRWTPLGGVLSVALGVALIITVMVDKVWPQSVWLWRAWSTLSPADRAVEIAILALGTLVFNGMASVPMIVGWSFTRVRLRRVTFTGDGLVVTTSDAPVRTILWHEVTSIRNGFVWRLRTDAGDTVRIPLASHSAHVLWFHRRRLHGTPKPLTGRRLLTRVLVIHQIGGVIGAAMAPITGMPAWQAYLAIAWGLPLTFVFPGALLWLMTRVSRSRSDAKRRQRRRGVNQAGPRPALIRHPAAVSPPPR